MTRQEKRAAEREVWVVGGSRGIGRALSESLARSYRVRALTRSSGHDFADAETAARLVREHGAPWAWVHTPGDFFEKALLETGDDEWHALFESNLYSFVRSARSILPAMAASGGEERGGARGGRVVAFGVAGLSVPTAKRLGPAYFAVKAALLQCVRSLASEFAGAGVCVNMLSPGAIVHEDSHAASQERVAPKIPAGRLGAPQDFVGLVEFLLSDASSYVTGQEICVDGGLALGRPAL